MKNRQFRILMTAAMIATLAFGSLSPMSTVSYAKEAHPTAQKDETVYVKVDERGEVKTVTVSDQLKNVGSVPKIEDDSVLKDIQNVKGDETFHQSGDHLTWASSNKDICYQGTTEKELPVGLNISYQLDGKPISAKKLKGKSGHLTIRYEYKNTSSQSGNYIPFLMVSSLIFDSDHFSNIAVTNGKIISDGDRNIVIGMGLPQMKQELGVTDLNIPDYFEIEADVTDYSTVTGMTVAANSLFNHLETDHLDSISDLQASMGQLQSSSEALVSGTSKLKTGIGTLLSSSGTLIEGVDTLTEGSRQLANGTGQLLDGTRILDSGASKLAEGTKAAVSGTSSDSPLAQGARSLSNGLEELNRQSSALCKGIDELTTAFTMQNGLTTGAAVIAQGTENLANALSAATGQTNSGTIIDISAGAASSSQAINTLMSVKNELALTNENGKNDAAINQINTAINQMQASHSESSAALTKAQQALTGLEADPLTGLAQTARQLAAAASSLQQGIQRTAAGANTLNSQVNNPDRPLTASSKALWEGANHLSEGINALNSNLSQLSAGASQVNAGSKTLHEKMAEADSGADTLAAGITTLQSGSNALLNGVQQLDNGATVLNNGMIQFNEEGIEKLVQAFDGDINELLNNLNTMIASSKAYKNFSGISEQMEGEVKFIFVTDK